MELRIRELRKQRGWTQKDLAKAARCLPSSISMYETQVQKVPVDALARIAVALGVTLDELVVYEPEPESALAATEE